MLKYPPKQKALQITDIKQYCQNLKELEQFINNVEIDSRQLPTNSNLSDLQGLIKKNPIRWVYPVRKLCMRYIEEAKIINKLHTLFLKEAMKAKCYFETLPVIDSQAIPTRIENSELEEYLFNSFHIYLMMHMFSKANKKINQLVNKISKDHMKQRRNHQIYCYLLFTKFYGGHVKKQSVMAASGLDIVLSPMRNINVVVDHEKLFILENFINYCHGENYNEEVIKMIVFKEKSELINHLYSLSKSENAKLRSYVNELKSSKLERQKRSQILEKPLQIPENMKTINMISEIARYDAKQKLLYINHQSATQEQVNQLITKCFELNQALKQIKVVKENHSPVTRGGFGGLGGLGGFGGHGFGGLAGFGMKI